MIYNVHNFVDFYKTELGQLVYQDLSALITPFFLNCKDQTILGIGFSHLYLQHINSESNSIISFMPERIGGYAWPTDHTQTALVHDWLFPLPNQSVDQILLVHCLEFLSNPTAFFDEIWRVLKKDGKLLMIFPNRRGLWARSDHTPFGYGQPYTMTQAVNLISNYGFVTTQKLRALHFAPTSSSLIYYSSKIFCGISLPIIKKFSGVNAIWAEKKTLVLSPTAIKNEKNMEAVCITSPS